MLVNDGDPQVMDPAPWPLTISLVNVIEREEERVPTEMFPKLSADGFTASVEKP